MLAILLMGFSSGLPLALSGATLGLWLARSGVSKAEIGLFAYVALPYSLKFLWSPVFDRLAAPWALKTLGRRRAWMLLSQFGLALALVATGLTEPAIAPWWTALGALAIAFFSASQDIVVDAYRVERLAPDEQGAGAAATQAGYRVGLLAAGAGALFLSDLLPWSGVYFVMAGLVGIGVATALLAADPGVPPTTDAGSGPSALERAVVEPFREFLGRPGWAVAMIFILLFNLGDALAGHMVPPFYVELGFTNAEIASVTKIIGFAAAIGGVAIGGAMIRARGLRWTLVVGGIAKALGWGLFALLARIGHSVAMLGVTITADNIVTGIASAAFVAYLGGLCRLEFTATQYALLSSLPRLGGLAAAGASGWLATRLGDWSLFFLAASVTALPGLAALRWAARGAQADGVRAD